MTCPKCKLESTCGCESCKERKGPSKTNNIMEVSIDWLHVNSKEKETV